MTQKAKGESLEKSKDKGLNMMIALHQTLCDCRYGHSRDKRSGEVEGYNAEWE